MKKLILTLIVVLVVAVGVTVLYLDSVVKQGIEVVGSELLGTEVTVASVSISPLDGSGRLRGLNIRNPAGFSSEYAFQLDEVAISLDPASLLSDVVEVDYVRINQPQITYEAKLTTDNIRTLLANLPESDSSEPASDDGAEGQRLIIREFLMTEPQVTLTAANRSAPVSLPDVALNDIGDGGIQSSAANVLRTILGGLSRAILQSNIPNMDDLRMEVEGRLQEGVDQVETLLQDSVDSTVEDLGSRLRNILN